MKDYDTGLYGIIDSKGMWAYKPEFEEIRRFTKEGLAVAKDPTTELFGIIDTSGEWVFEPQFTYYKYTDFGYFIVDIDRSQLGSSFWESAYRDYRFTEEQ